MWLGNNMNKSHLYFRNPTEGVKRYKQKSRFIPNNPEEEAAKNYTPMKDSFSSSLRTFFQLQTIRVSRRNLSLNIPLNIDYIVLRFFDYFESTVFESRYRNNFGLVPIRYEEFNTIGYFAIHDLTKFQSFTSDIETFINTEDPQISNAFNPDIKYIQSFTFHSSDKIKLYTEPKEIVILDLFDSLELFNEYDNIVNALTEYLEERELRFLIDKESNKIEIFGAGETTINEIIDNFDVIHSVNSSLAGIVRPSAFNLPIREFGFTITNASDDLPLIGIIDTGIGGQTPLSSLIINDGNEFDITGTSPHIDNADHGTGVAALASLGKSLYPDHLGSFKADAKLLSIKVLDAESGPVSQIAVERLIREANRKYDIKLFVLTIAYEDPLSDNSNISPYAYSLDLLADELDILIFISVGNINGIINYMYDHSGTNLVPYPNNFTCPDYNLCSPSDSMNNLSCGSISDNIEEKVLNFNEICYSPDPSFPSSYSRKYNIGRYHNSFKVTRISKHLVKPDCVYPGGDYEANTEYSHMGLKVLSATTGEFYKKEVGTSYSAPLLANLAAKILKAYPALKSNMQTVKALILNSATYPATGDLFTNLNNIKLIDLIGKGVPNENYAVYSDDNLITIILEDSINPEEIKSYPIKIPSYLNNLDSQRSLLEVKATLCFKFQPISQNHLTYCPFHIAFGIFKDLPLERNINIETGEIESTGINGNSVQNIKFRESWSEDYYFKAKILSNCQKLEFIMTKKDLLNENNQFKIAIHSKFHKLLSQVQKEINNKTIPFSLVISLREKPIAGIISNRLYNEMLLVNELEAIGELEAEADLTMS